MIDVSHVDLLCLDAGNTVIFLDHTRLASVLGVANVETVIRVEGEAKRLAETGDLVDVDWSGRARPAAAGWGKMVGTIAHLSGTPRGEVGALLDAAWAEHVKLNFWCKVPDGLGAALDAIRAKGTKVTIISNSEGMLEALFHRLGIRQHFDSIVDSGLVGVEKPDPRIFDYALEAFGAARTHTLHLGDMFATDILGARAAGVRSALIDPYGHYEGRHLDVPRVAGIIDVARAILRA